MMKSLMATFLLVFSFMITETSLANDVKVNELAPTFKVKNQDGKDFDLSSRKGQWTVLYFYPKAGTPGCTKQACAFRDSISKIREQGADVFGISADTVEAQKGFHKEHHLNFDLLADPDDKVINLYGAKMTLLKMSHRWTFILDPELKIKNIMKDVDPVLDADRVAQEISKLKKTVK